MKYYFREHGKGVLVELTAAELNELKKEAKEPWEAKAIELALVDSL